MVTGRIYSTIIRAVSSTLYVGGRSNGPPSPEADLNGASLMLALLARSAQLTPARSSGCGCSEIDRLGLRSELVKQWDRARSRRNLAGV